MLIGQEPTTTMPQALDRQTVESLYRKYASVVERRCLELSREPADASDAVQEVFVKLLTKGGTFRKNAEWSTFLYRVATNACLNRLRNSKRQRELLEIHGDPVRPRSSSHRDAVDARIDLQFFFDHTDRKTQEIVCYRHRDGMSYQEIGEIIGTSGEAVRKRLKKFQRVLDKHPEWKGE